MQTRDELPSFAIVKSKLLDEAERHKTNAEKTESAGTKVYAVHTKEAKATNYKKSNGPVSGQRRNGTKSLQRWVCGQLGHKLQNANKEITRKVIPRIVQKKNRILFRAKALIRAEFPKKRCVSIAAKHCKFMSVIKAIDN